jgi:phosphoadenosine phosphosulfate reductase
MSILQHQYENLLTFYERNPALNADDLIKFTIKEFGAPRVVLASSLSVEDQVLTLLLTKATSHPRIFTLDTGRLSEETYHTIETTARQYNFNYEILCPDTTELEHMTNTYGPDLFYRSIELRKLCCSVRKTHPLKRVLATADAWICGLRSEQSITRSGLKPVEWDEMNSIIKINPLYNWTEKQVWDYIRSNNIPFNQLQEHGFRSIGCAPCTRAVNENDDIRAGRWWWEQPEHKECGLHGRA